MQSAKNKEGGAGQYDPKKLEAEMGTLMDDTVFRLFDEWQERRRGELAAEAKAHGLEKKATQSKAKKDKDGKGEKGEKGDKAENETPGPDAEETFAADLQTLELALGIKKRQDHAHALNDRQHALLGKLISFDCMRLTDESDTLKQELYEWFFKWDGTLKLIAGTKAYEWVDGGEKGRGEDSDEERLNEAEKTEEQIEEEKRKA